MGPGGPSKSQPCFASSKWFSCKETFLLTSVEVPVNSDLLSRPTSGQDTGKHENEGTNGGAPRGGCGGIDGEEHTEEVEF